MAMADLAEVQALLDEYADASRDEGRVCANGRDASEEAQVAFETRARLAEAFTEAVRARLAAEAALSTALEKLGVVGGAVASALADYVLRCKRPDTALCDAMRRAVSIACLAAPTDAEPTP